MLSSKLTPPKYTDWQNFSKHIQDENEKTIPKIILGEEYETDSNVSSDMTFTGDELLEMLRDTSDDKQSKKHNFNIFDDNLYNENSPPTYYESQKLIKSESPPPNYGLSENDYENYEKYQNKSNTKKKVLKEIDFKINPEYITPNKTFCTFKRDLVDELRQVVIEDINIGMNRPFTINKKDVDICIPKLQMGITRLHIQIFLELREALGYTSMPIIYMRHMDIINAIRYLQLIHIDKYGYEFGYSYQLTKVDTYNFNHSVKTIKELADERKKYLGPTPTEKLNKDFTKINNLNDIMVINENGCIVPIDKLNSNENETPLDTEMFRIFGNDQVIRPNKGVPRNRVIIH